MWVITVGEQISDRYNPSRQLKVNVDGSINTKQTDGKTELTLYDLKNMEVSEILYEILKELKKMNLQLAVMTDNVVRNTEVE